MSASSNEYQKLASSLEEYSKIPQEEKEKNNEIKLVELLVEETTITNEILNSFSMETIDKAIEILSNYDLDNPYLNHIFTKKILS